MLVGQEATVRTGHGTIHWTGSKLGKGYLKGVYCHPCSFNLYAEYIMWNARLDEAQAGIKIAWRIINTSDMQMTPPLCPYDRKQRRTKEPLDESERGEWKSWLKIQHQKMKIMASSPITSWEIDGETVETVSDFIFVGSKITTDGYCSHEIKRCLLLGSRVMTNLDSIFKNGDITLPTRFV